MARRELEMTELETRTSLDNFFVRTSTIHEFLDDSKVLKDTLESYGKVQRLMITDPPASLRVIDLGTSGICFESRLHEMSIHEKYSEYKIYNVNFRHFSLLSKSVNDEDVVNGGRYYRPIGVTIKIEPDQYIFVESDYLDVPVTAMINIVNNGMYDVSKVTPGCTENYFTKEHCIRGEHIRRKVIERECICTQLTGFIDPQKTIETLQTQMKRDLIANGSFCDLQSYESCWLRASLLAERAVQGACEPCRIPRNFHQLTLNSLGSSFLAPGETFPRIGLWFTCDEKTYLLFEEKHQFSLSQYISQIGGDLSLYIGFNLIGVAQILIYTFEYFGKRSRSNGENSSGIFHRWMDTLYGSVSFDDSKNEGKVASTDDLESLRNEIRMMSLELGKLKAEIQKST